MKRVSLPEEVFKHKAWTRGGKKIEFYYANN
jgi:hypothetical protein